MANTYKKKFETEDENYQGTHPSQDKTDRYSDDQILRIYGFKIVSRPKNREAICLLPFLCCLRFVFNLNRPNIVVSGGKPFEEDLWKCVAVGDTVLSLVKVGWGVTGRTCLWGQCFAMAGDRPGHGMLV